MDLKFRPLKENEIDVRIGTINEKGLTLLLYKDARCDMNILDETIGPLNWKRLHIRDNQNCIVSVFDKEKNQWIDKEDTGTESYTEKEKGLASDSFKRACVNWGIGRELYTAPFIYIPNEKCKIYKNSNGKYATYDKFLVEKITYTSNKEIDGLSIKNQRNERVFLKKPKEVKNENN